MSNTDLTAVIHARVTDEDVDDLDELRRKERDIPTRSVMLRRLIARASGRESEGQKKAGARR